MPNSRDFDYVHLRVEIISRHFIYASFHLYVLENGDDIQDINIGGKSHLKYLSTAEELGTKLKLHIACHRC